jgi:hypothetical protein
MYKILSYYPLDKHNTFLSKRDVPPFIHLRHRSTLDHVLAYIPCHLHGMKGVVQIIMKFLETETSNGIWESIYIQNISSRFQLSSFFKTEYAYFWSQVIRKLAPRPRSLTALVNICKSDFKYFRTDLPISEDVIDRMTEPNKLISQVNIYYSTIGQVGSLQDVKAKKQVMMFQGNVTNNPFISMNTHGTHAIITHSCHFVHWSKRHNNIVEAKFVLDWNNIIQYKYIIFDIDELQNIPLCIQNKIRSSIIWSSVIIDRIVPQSDSSYTEIDHRRLHVYINKYVRTIDWIFNNRKYITYISNIPLFTNIQPADIIDILFLLRVEYSGNSLFILPTINIGSNVPAVYNVDYQKLIRCAYTMFCGDYIVHSVQQQLSTQQQNLISFSDHLIYDMDTQPIVYQCPKHIPRLHYVYETIITWLISSLAEENNIVFFYHKYRIFGQYILSRFPHIISLNGRDTLLHHKLYTNTVFIVLDDYSEPYMKTYIPFLGQVCYFIKPYKC